MLQDGSALKSELSFGHLSDISAPLLIISTDILYHFFIIPIYHCKSVLATKYLYFSSMLSSLPAWLTASSHKYYCSTHFPHQEVWQHKVYPPWPSTLATSLEMHQVQDVCTQEIVVLLLVLFKECGFGSLVLAYNLQATSHSALVSRFNASVLCISTSVWESVLGLNDLCTRLDLPPATSHSKMTPWHTSLTHGWCADHFRVFFPQNLLLLVSFNSDLSYNLFKSQDSATSVTSDMP